MIPRTDAILACLADFGEQSGPDLARRVGLPYNKTFRSSVANLKVQGRVMARQEYVKRRGSSAFIYSLPKPVYIPQISGTEYLGWFRTGTRAEDCRRVAA